MPKSKNKNLKYIQAYYPSSDEDEIPANEKEFEQINQFASEVNNNIEGIIKAKNSKNPIQKKSVKEEMNMPVKNQKTSTYSTQLKQVIKLKRTLKHKQKDINLRLKPRLIGWHCVVI